ncbi:prohead protease/major capsid protein fusion protein [Rhodopseudomonas sp. B29]|uniref:prohead protease/major capsid protein fusion protein n=1 Tax=Rhodopseudomonas sp. B29 TaxID=95607 RepID=UPI00034D8A5C|nr:prohead protease/major capsid protein fusion protein [Rhodopseudomonas sp. B29]
MKMQTRSAARPRLTPDGFEPGATVVRAATDDLDARFRPQSYDKATRTVEAVFSAGSRVARWGVYEELAIGPAAVDLTRVALGQCRALDTHSQSSIDDVRGVVTEAWFEGGLLVGRIRFADTEAGRRAEGMVARGEITGVSVGYRVTTWTLASLANEVEVWRADRWELLEVSLVSVPADPQASFRSTQVNTQRAGDAQSQEEDDMRRNAANPTESTTPAASAAATVPAPEAVRTAPAPAPEAPRTVADVTRAAPAADAAALIAAERTRTAEISDIGTRAGMSADQVQAALRDGTGVEVFRARAFDHMAAQADRTRTGSITVTRDETDTRHRFITDALTVRMGGAGALRGEDGQARALDAAAREYVGYRFSDVAATIVGERRMPITAADREDVIRRAMTTTGDLPVIFENVVNRVLLARYQLATPTYRRISVQRNFSDFRPHEQLRVGDFPTLQPVTQSGEIKFGNFGDSKETVAVAPYAVQFAISRRILIDDNVGAIDQMLGSYGDTVARFEEATFYAMKAINNGNGPTLNDGNAAVFNTAKHGNLAAAGTAIDSDALGVGRASMRKQTNQSGNLLNLQARILAVGPDKETEADRAVAIITPTTEQAVNPFGGKLETVVMPVAGNAWELYADPAVAPCFVWGMLDGYNAPRLRIENPFGVQGVGVSLEHDFGCGAVDYRGAYRNPGNATG